MFARTTKPPGVGACSTSKDLLLNMWEVAPLSMMRQRVLSWLTLKCQVDPSGAVRAHPRLVARCGALKVADAEINK